MGELGGEYFTWLSAKVVVSDQPSQSYSRLLELLYLYEFEWQLKGDENRAEDGCDLRDDFLIETGSRENALWDDDPPSMLEVLYALALRAEWQTEMSAVDWFWTFINNLGLGDQDDDQFSEGYVYDILYSFVERTYESDGSNGGLFPLRKPKEDQREVEIWYQLSAYLAEHHEIGL